MWKRINTDPKKGTSILEKKMRYFIFYPPSNSIRLVDVGESVRVEDVLDLVQREFGLKVERSGPSEASIVLSYNGFDLKPKWPLADLGIPSGAIIRCIYREEKAPDLYIHCGFNKQVLKLFDSTITIETPIVTIRKLISEKLGLPLSTFCLETYDGKKRLYDETNLMKCDIKIHDHLQLKVWRGYEKYITSCIKGFTEHYSRDDLTRHYQTQIALYIAAFYGHMELASSVMQHGARSDRPVGEHPSRQWSSSTSTNSLPEMLKCPIHIAIERGHVKMVDLFVRQSILCTQIRDPITAYLPYQLALSCFLSAKTKEEKQCFNEIYFCLHDKQYNLKIPINATGEYVSRLLTSTTTANAALRLLTNHVYISLSMYCKIISWYERAREKAWKKFGGRFYTTSQTKRVYPKHGLLGYKVLIDGYNHTFNVPSEQLRNVQSDDASRADHYHGYSDEEHEKIIGMKTFMKQFVLNEQRRTRQIVAANLQQSRRPPQATTVDTQKPPLITIQAMEDISSFSEFSNSQMLSSTPLFDSKEFKSMPHIQNSSVSHLLPSVLVSSSRVEDSDESKTKSRRTSKMFLPRSSITHVVKEEDYTLPRILSPASKTSTTHSASSHKFEPLVSMNKPVMSSVDAYLISSTRLAQEKEEHQRAQRDQLFKQIEQSVEQVKNVNLHSDNLLSTVPSLDRNSMLDVDSYLPLPDHPTFSDSGPIKSRIDLAIRQATVVPYEQYISASTRTTAIHCLKEATHFKKKSWLKQVEISKEMVRNKVQRCIRRGISDDTYKKPTVLPLRATVDTTPYKSPVTTRVN